MRCPDRVLLCVGILGLVLWAISGCLPATPQNNSKEGWAKEGNSVYSKILTVEEQRFLVVKTTRGVAITPLDEEVAE